LGSFVDSTGLTVLIIPFLNISAADYVYFRLKTSTEPQWNEGKFINNAPATRTDGTLTTSNGTMIIENPAIE